MSNLLCLGIKKKLFSFVLPSTFTIFAEKTTLTMKITCERLRRAYSEGEALAIYNEVKQEGDFVAFAREFMHHEDYRVARNALWALTKASNQEFETLQSMLHEFIELAMSAENSSVRRLSLNLVERLKMNEEDLRTDFLDFCFERMIDVEEYPGIQSISMKLAFRMCKFYPELTDELKRTLEAMEIDYYKPAVKSIRNRILSGKYK